MADTKFLIFVENEEAYPLEEEAIIEAAQRALTAGKSEIPASLSIIVITSEIMRDYYFTYAGKDEPTDVLTFPAEDTPYATEPGAPPYLGDILIAYPIAEKQAEEAGHSTTHELQILSIHGVLHLLGFDHGTPEEHALMYGLQNEIASEL